MEIPDLKKHIDLLGIEEFLEIWAYVVDQRNDREARAKFEAQIQVETVRQLFGQHPELKPQREQGETWEHPETITEGYMRDDRVTHNGSAWVSTLSGVNMGEPGVSDGWALLESQSPEPDRPDDLD